MKIAVGLSGGVDSSVAALLLRDQGHEVTGITMRLWRGTYRGGTRDACYGPGEEEDIARARRGSPSTGAPVGPSRLRTAYATRRARGSSAWRQASRPFSTTPMARCCAAALSGGRCDGRFFSAYRIDAEWVRVTLLGPLDDPKLNDILASLPGATVTAIN